VLKRGITLNVYISLKPQFLSHGVTVYI